jgi:hypothetical protein
MYLKIFLKNLIYLITFYLRLKIYKELKKKNMKFKYILKVRNVFILEY